MEGRTVKRGFLERCAGEVLVCDGANGARLASFGYRPDQAPSGRLHPGPCADSEYLAAGPTWC